MKKLLLMGVSNDTRYVLEYAKRIGVWTIITDNRSVEQYPIKKQADELWHIDVADLDALEEKCRAEQISGVYAGNNEFCLDCTKALCKRLNLPFYASDEAWACARDKTLFKKTAQDCGLMVPKRHYLNEQMILDGSLEIVTYPVIVKPVDSCGARGITICRNESNLLEAYRLAAENSVTGRVIVEDYITGPVTNATYLVKNGRAELLMFQKIYTDVGEEKICMGLAATDGAEFNAYTKQTDAAVQKMMKKLRCENGTMLLQSIVSGGVYYFIEMGYRLDGVGQFSLSKQICGIDIVKYMVNLALGRPNHVLKKNSGIVGALYLVSTKEGFIREIQGLDKVTAVDGIELFNMGLREGQWTPATCGLYNLAYCWNVCGENAEELAKKITFIKKTVRHLDENGEDMLFDHRF